MTRTIPLLLIAPLLCVGLTACAANDGQTTITNDSFESPSARPSQPSADADVGDSEVTAGNNYFAEVGEAVLANGLRVTLNSVTRQGASEFYAPDNDFYLVANFTIENVSNEAANISSFGSFDLQGSDLYKYSLAFGADVKGSLDDAIRAGGSLRGEIAFDVPQLDFYELSFSPSIFNTDEDVVWRVSSAQISNG
jgi:hypothetical protein